MTISFFGEKFFGGPFLDRKIPNRDIFRVLYRGNGYFWIMLHALGLVDHAVLD